MTPRSLGLAGAAAALFTLITVTPTLAWTPWLDAAEDRIDRAESIKDRQTDNSRLDVLEDRADRIESRRDKRGFDNAGLFDRHERRSWKRKANDK